MTNSLFDRLQEPEDNYKEGFLDLPMRAADLLTQSEEPAVKSKFGSKFIKKINPLYSFRNFLIVSGALLILFSIPVTIYLVQKAREPAGIAAVNNTPDAGDGCTYQKLPLEQLTKESSLVVRGRVKKITSTLEEDKNIYSVVELSTEESLKQPSDKNISLRVVGGTVGDKTEIFGCDAQFREGEEVLLFLEKHPKKPSVYRAEGGFQGKYRITTGNIASRRIKDEAPVDFNNLYNRVKSQTDGQTYQPRENLYEKFAGVFEKLSDLLFKQANAYSVDQSGAGDYMRRWPHEKNVPYYIDIHPYPSAGNASFDSTRAGFAAWSNAGAQVSIYDAGYIDRPVTGADGTNVVTYQDPNDMLPSGSWAGAPTTYLNNQSMVVNGVPFYRLWDSDIVMNPGYNWNSTSVGAIITHELGHGLGMGHSQYSDAIMYWAAPTWRGASLSSDDIAGIQFIYPQLPNVTLNGRATNSVTGAGIGGVVINQNSNPCGGLSGTATTDGNGYFQFSNIPTGLAFCLRAPTLSGYSGPVGGYECQVAGVFSNPDSCGQNLDSSVDNAYNFSYAPALGEILGRVWLDTNGNRIPDAGELLMKDPSATCTTGDPVSGVSIQYSGPTSGSTIVNLCNADPYYDIPNLTPGTYTLNGIAPVGWEVTGIHDGGPQSNPISVSVTAGNQSHRWVGMRPVSSCNSATVGTNQFVGCLWEGTNFEAIDGAVASGPTMTSPVADSATALDVNWGLGAPNSTVGSDTFSAQWKGNFAFKPGTYTFTGGSDDGMRVRVNGVTKIDQWIDRPYAENTFTQTFTSQATVPIEIDYFEGVSLAQVKFRWIYTPPPDSTPPTVSLTAPTSGSFVSGTSVAMSANPVDNAGGSGIARVDFYLDGSATPVGTVSASPYTWTWNTMVLTNSSHTVSAKAVDNAGNVSTAASVTVTVDNSAPTVTITAPAANAFLKGTAVTISATAPDNTGGSGTNKVEFLVDNVVKCTDTASPYSCSWNTTTATAGTHSLTAKGYDNQNNVGTSTAATVTVDNTPPTVSITVPANGATVSSTVTITATATDATTSITKVEFTVDSSLVCTDATSPYSCSWNTTTLNDGSHTIGATAYDTLGNTGVASITVTVSNDKTAPSVSITAPSSGAFVAGTVAVTATASDNVGVTQIEFYVDNVLKNTDATSPYSWNLNTAGYTNATHNLTAKAYDTANNIGTSTSVSVTVDNSAPIVSISAPAGGAFVSGGAVSVTSSASDNVAVVKVEFYLDNVLQSTDTISPYSWNWNTTSASNGSHTLSAKAYDSAGNNSTSASVAVTVDNLGPTVSITSPANAATVSGTTSISATASDNTAVTKVEFLVDGVFKGQDTSSPYSFSWDTTTYSNGSHTLTANAYDAAGNITTSAQINVTVNNIVADTQKPTVPTNLTATAVNSSQINLSWTASTDNVGVVGYNIIRNGVVIATSTTTSFGDGTLSPNTTYTYTISAFDAAGNTSNPSTSASATTPAPADTTNPTVSVTAPANNASVSGTAAVTASASDNVGVAKVEFYIDGSLKSTDTSSPYSFSWDTTSVTNASHQITAKAYDGANNSATSSVVTVTVNNGNASADINGDAKVNVLDLSIILSKWGSNYAPSDLNKDSTVNILDLSILLSNWLP